MKLVRLLLLIAISHYSFTGFSQELNISSPDKKITLTSGLKKGKLFYQVFSEGKTILLPSRLGLRLTNSNFYDNLELVRIGKSAKIQDNYTLVTGKINQPVYKANKKTIWLKNREGKEVEVIFQVSNDGIVFRYHIPETVKEELLEEFTSYHFPDTSKSWLQPMSEAKTGWEQSNPSYEEKYYMDQKVGAPSKAGWVYPALFRSNKTWVLISEAAVDTMHCATRLVNDSGTSNYRTGTPDPREIFPGGNLLSQINGNWFSPWRIMAIGNLSTIANSTLGTDVAPKSIINDDSFVKGGQASWSWINSKDDFIIYAEQKKYVDYAARMGWEYCLVDVNWDTKIGYDSIAHLASYARSKNVGLILWYNSAGSWNTTPYHPRDLMLTEAARRSEFRRLQQMGIKGVKIDFFGGDGQSMVAYYHAILMDAAAYKLLVNFHGATLPRGWQRTYPHLVTAEAVKGFEMVTFGQDAADAQAAHCAMLPFTRNVFDPMDFTPMNLFKIPTSVQRKTSSAFELALSVVFWSGIQHYAESPEGMDNIPDFVQQFLRTLPNTWEEMKWIDGYPGEYVVIARKSGKKWYIAGINGTGQPKTFRLDLTSWKFSYAQLIVDGTGTDLFNSAKFSKQGFPASITLKPAGGFVVELED